MCWWFAVDARVGTDALLTVVKRGSLFLPKVDLRRFNCSLKTWLIISIPTYLDGEHPWLKDLCISMNSMGELGDMVILVRKSQISPRLRF